MSACYECKSVRETEGNQGKPSQLLLKFCRQVPLQAVIGKFQAIKAR
uniref:Uncharacterized protein n=1 Tax=Anguilla anguilla TaxID=7936 RepID=A0A0E9S1A6_ANGAN